MSAILVNGVLVTVSADNPMPVTLDTNIDSTTLTKNNGTITTGGASQVLFAANANRKGFWIRNNSAGSLYINRAGATATTSDFELKTGEYFETPSFERTTNAIGIIGATTGQAFSAGECA